MNRKRTIKRVISSLLCTAVVITSLPGLEAMADTSYTEIASRADVDVALRMGVIADSQYTAGAGTAKLDAALQVLNEIDADYDGLAMVGDIVYQSSSTAVKTDVYDMLDTSLNTYAKNGEEAKPYIFAMGNHEFPLNLKVASNAALVQTAKETYKSRYCPDAEYDSTTNEGPYINQIFGATDTNTGYHFITAAPIDYSNQLSTTSENWVLDQVDAAIAEDANKPVFLLLHQPIQNTAFGSSTVRYSDEFKSELQKRPQVVVLSGHTHYATNDPRMIWQDGFTLAMIGCTGGGMNARYADYAEGNEVTLLEVDENNVVKFYRIDVNSKQYIGEPWELDIPAMVRAAATVEPIEKYVSESTSYDCNTNNNQTGKGAYGWLFSPAHYVTYTFDVPVSGEYELGTVVGSNNGGTMSVLVDGTKFNSIIVPSGSINTKNVVDAGSYYLEAGSHTVKFTSETGSATIQMWSALLTNESLTYVKTINASEYNNLYQGHKNELSGSKQHLVLYANAGAYVDFPVNLLEEGTYDVYVDAGTNGDTTVWSATIGGKTTSHEFPKTGSYGTHARQNLGSVELTAGSKTLRMKLTSNNATTSIRRVILAKNVAYTDIWKYTSARTESAVTPEFPETAGITVSSVSTSGISVQFPQLRTKENSEDVIVGYRIQVINQRMQQQVQSYSISSDYYKAEKEDTVSTTISNLAASTKYVVNVYGISAFGKVSEKPITRTVRTKEAEKTTTTVTDTRETITKYVSESTSKDCNTNSDSTGKGTYGWLFAPGNYVTYTFDVTNSGEYEIITTVGVGAGGTMAVEVDGTKFDSITVPSGGINTKNKVSASFHFLEKGTHTVKFTSETGSSTIQMWSAALVKEDDAVITTVNALDYKSQPANTGVHSTYAMSCWANGTAATYSVNVPKDGTYDIYVDGTSKAEGDSWNALIGGKTLTATFPAKSAYTPYTRVKYGSVTLSKGTQTLKMTSVRASSDSVILRRIVLVQEGSMDYVIEQKAYEGGQQAGYSGNASPEGWGIAFWNGYVTFAVTPEHTGVYNLSWVFASSGCEASTYLNGELIDTRTYTGGSTSGTSYVGATQSVGNYIMNAGETYYIKIADYGGLTSINIERLVLTYLRKATLEDGITIDAYVGDHVGTTATKYSDGKDTNPGYGFADGLYMEFDVEIEQAGLYDVALQLGCDSASSVSVYANGTLVATKEEINCGDYNARNMEDFGEVVLQEGTHRFKVICNSGGIQLYKLKLKSVRGLTDEDPYAIKISATSYSSNNLTGDSKIEGSAAVLANASSYMQYDVELPAGNYVFSITYSRATTAQMGLVVNGEAVGNYALPAVNSYTKKAVAVVSLEEGINSIRVQGSGAYYYFTYIHLEKITSPVSELYNGDYISQEVSVAEEFTGDVEGDLIFRTYLPAGMKGQFVQVIGSIYDGDTLVDTVWAEPVMATANSVVIARLTDAELDAAKTYTWKVKDYICYSTEDADETGDVNLSGNAHDKTAFGVKLILEDTNATFSYASGIFVALKDNGSLGVTIGDQEVEIAPTEFETFKDQVFELQITTDVTEDTANMGIWIDKKLANQTYYTIATDTLDGSISCSNDGLLCYTLWKIAKPDVYSADYIQLQGETPYVVEYDSMVYTDGTTYAIGEQTTAIGDYTVSVCGVEYEAILWKGYDLHSDGELDAKDLVSMKKVEDKQVPDSKAGYMAASQLNSAYELEVMRQNLVN